MYFWGECITLAVSLNVLFILDEFYLHKGVSNKRDIIFKCHHKNSFWDKISKSLMKEEAVSFFFILYICIRESFLSHLINRKITFTITYYIISLIFFSLRKFFHLINRKKYVLLLIFVLYYRIFL